MKENKQIFNLIIVDASGSMGSKIPEVQGGLNQLINQIKKDDAENLKVKNITTVVDFSSSGDFNVIVDRKSSDRLTLLQDGDYTTRGMTALYDAIGKGFLLVPKEADAVFVSVITDGQENDSKEFKPATIKSLIKEKEKNGWAVTFMGTTQEAMLSAENIGIVAERRSLYVDSKVGTTNAFRRMSMAKRNYTSAVMESRAPVDLFKEDGPADE